MLKTAMNRIADSFTLLLSIGHRPSPTNFDFVIEQTKKEINLPTEFLATGSLTRKVKLVLAAHNTLKFCTNCFFN
jgi:hypothetical protein